MKTLYIKDLKKGTIITEEAFAVKSIEKRETKDKKNYFVVELIDKTGTIKANIWQDSIPNVSRQALVPGSIMLLSGKVEEYRGNLQVNILSGQKVDEGVVDDFIEASDFDIDELWKELNSYIDKVKNEKIKKLLNKIFDNSEIQRKYKTHPAAEYVHHQFHGGLLEHVVEMLDILQPLKKFYPEADYDLVTAGIILHDIGKLFELEPVGMTITRTTKGYLIGHLIMSYEILLEYGKDILDEKTLLNLKHIILAHHGMLEFGSPVLPATIEANMVSWIDQLSTKTRIYQKILRRNTNNESEFTERDSLIGTKLFLGNFMKTVEDTDDATM